MILDCHVHLMDDSLDVQSMMAGTAEAGIGGGILILLPPNSFYESWTPRSAEERLAHLFAWCKDRPSLYPFYWIDPLEDDAEAQVGLAVSRGIAGFKVICDRFFPGDARALAVYRAIARADKPMLFHSGILWDGKDSSRYCRPVEFEALLAVENLRFALAHISWPWCDELIAFYGKWVHARAMPSKRLGEMFIDLTPGTPPIYRREVLTRLMCVGYDINRNLLFGSDNFASKYSSAWTKEWIERDRAIFRELDIPDSVQQAIYGENLLRFLGVKAGSGVSSPR